MVHVINNADRVPVICEFTRESVDVLHFSFVDYIAPRPHFATASGVVTRCHYIVQILDRVIPLRRAFQVPSS